MLYIYITDTLNVINQNNKLKVLLYLKMTMIHVFICTVYPSVELTKTHLAKHALCGKLRLRFTITLAFCSRQAGANTRCGTTR